MIKKCKRDITPLGNSIIKFLLIMKLTTLLLIVGSLQVSASLYSQNTKIDLNIHNGTIQDVFNEIEKQSNFNIFFKTDEVNARLPVDITARGIMVKEVLDRILEGSNLGYKVLDKIIVVVPVDALVGHQQKISGAITDATTGEPIIGASVLIEGTTIGVITDSDGKFSLDISKSDAVIVISFLGYNTEHITLNGKSVLDIKLIPDITKLDEIVVVGYGMQKKGNVTGSIASVKSKELTVAPLSALLIP